MTATLACIMDLPLRLIRAGLWTEVPAALAVDVQPRKLRVLLRLGIDRRPDTDFVTPGNHPSPPSSLSHESSSPLPCRA